jgi:hypothetical protein
VAPHESRYLDGGERKKAGTAPGSAEEFLGLSHEYAGAETGLSLLSYGLYIVSNGGGTAWLAFARL